MQRLDRDATSDEWPTALTWMLAHLKPLPPPEPINPLLIDVLVTPKECPNAPIAIAWMFVRQSLNLLCQLDIAVGLRVIIKRRAMQLEQGASALGRDTTLDQHIYDLALRCDIYSFLRSPP